MKNISKELIINDLIGDIGDVIAKTIRDKNLIEDKETALEVAIKAIQSTLLGLDALNPDDFIGLIKGEICGIAQANKTFNKLKENK